MAEINRDEKQEKAAQLWMDSDQYNSLILGTGFGKSKLAMIVLQKLFDSKTLSKGSKILLLSDSEKLRDTNWKEDFIKWGYTWLWDIITSECYQTVYRWKDTEWDLVIADEVDAALTEKYSKCFTNNKFKRVLGLTGFVTETKQAMMEFLVPSLTEYSTQDAQKDGILNKTQITFISYDLSRNKSDIKVEYKRGKDTKSFTQSESDAYDYAENTCNITWGKLSRLKNDPDIAMGLDPVGAQELKQMEAKYRRAIANRKELLLNCKAGVKTAQDLIKLLLQNPDNKIVTFSMLTDQADRINQITYHGKNKKVNFDVLDKLSTGEIRSVGVCKAINRGVNIAGLNSLIMESYDSSDTQFNQRHGRGTRLKPNEVMNLYILLPYYYKKVKSPENHGGMSHVRKPTQAVKWAKSMIKGFNIENPILIRKGIGENDWRRNNNST